MTRKQLGLAILVTADGTLVGTFTDGDLRRVFERVKDPRQLDARAAHARSRRSPSAPPVPISTVKAAHPAVECLRVMRDSQITSLIVVDDDDKPIGLLRLIDLVQAGLG
jgi:arabinose-5-phosphate isomerase